MYDEAHVGMSLKVLDNGFNLMTVPYIVLVADEHDLSFAFRERALKIL
jgi:hypothetical protein